MKIEINVDETQFKDILDKELQDLPKEVLQNIIVESIKGYFQQDPLPPDACKHCSNHPSNGGSGICNCTLGSPVIY